MGKQSKPSERAADEPRDVIRELAQQRSVEERAAARAVALRGQTLAPIVRTRECLFRVTQMIDGTPVVNLDLYRVATAAWARAIQDLAAAWKVFPRWGVTSRQRLPGQFAGFKAARDIWKLASAGASVEDLTARIEEAKAALGPMQEGHDRRDTELGIHVFFCELSGVYERYTERHPMAAADPKRRELPDPSRRALKAARTEVEGMEKDKRLRVADLIRLYRLEGVTVEQFRSSSKYIQRNSKISRKGWQLPFRVGRSDDRRQADGTLGEGRWWSPSDVMGAIDGWLEHLGDPRVVRSRRREKGPSVS